MKKNFKNRITQESPQMMIKLKSLWIDMNSDHKQTANTSHGLFALSLSPNCKVDSVKLEHDFNSILSHFYQWRFGSKWKKLKNIQNFYKGVIEKQKNGINHIHITIYQYSISELSLFVKYITTMFKSLYNKTSYRIKKIYDIAGWDNYISSDFTNKDKYKNKQRIEIPTLISSCFFTNDYVN